MKDYAIQFLVASGTVAMAIYSYKCDSCESTQRQMNSIDNRKTGPECCGSHMAQVIEAPMVNDNFLGSFKNEGYVSPLSGNYITSANQRRSEMVEYNVVEKE
jgi:predicted nucleic acid-binding Zn ribbon protein